MQARELDRAPTKESERFRKALGQVHTYPDLSDRPHPQG